MKRYPVITKKRGDKWYFRFTYGKRANGKTDDIQKAVGSNEKEARAVGEEMQTRLLEGKVTREELTSEYIEHVREELFDFSLSLFGDDSTSIEVNEPTQEQNVTESPLQEETMSQQTNSKRKPRKDKQEQEKYFPSFVPIVTEFFNIELQPLPNKKKNSSKMLDAYIFGLIQYCEKSLTAKCCYFSAETIAKHIGITRQSVMNSIEKLEFNKLIVRTKRQGKTSILNVNNMLGNQTCKESQRVRNPNDTCKESQQDNGLTCKESLHKQQHKDKEQQQLSDVAADKKGDTPFFDNKLKNCIKLWEDGTGRAIVPLQAEKLQSFIDDFSYEWTIHAMTYTFERDVKSPLPYINRILERWQASGLLKPWEHDSRPPSSQSQHKQRHEETKEEKEQRLLQDQKELDAQEREDVKRYEK